MHYDGVRGVVELAIQHEAQPKAVYCVETTPDYNVTSCTLYTLELFIWLHERIITNQTKPVVFELQNRFEFAQCDC